MDRKTHPTTQYAIDVMTTAYGEMCCQWEKLACQRHLSDLERQGTDGFPFVFDETRADRIIRWFEEICCHVRGPYTGQHIHLHPWQVFDQGSVFGWVHKDTGARRFRNSLSIRARGNVKSTENSAICCYMMCSDAIYPPTHPELAQYENIPEVACAAVDKDQAKRVWNDAREMAMKSPQIEERIHTGRTKVYHKTRGGEMVPLSKETKNKDSGAQTFISIDEYHAWPTSEIKDTLQGGFGKRHQALMSIISTAGVDTENNPCYKEQKTGEKILLGEISAENYFVMIRTLDDGDDPHDETLWAKPNPILRVDDAYSRNLWGEIKSEHNLAFNSGDYSKIRQWLTKRVNVWQMAAENNYLTTELVEKLRKSSIGRNAFSELTKGMDVYEGIDLSKKIDLTANGFVIPLPDGRYGVTGHGFIPEEAVQRHEHTDRVEYRMWVKDGWCTMTPGGVTDYDYITLHQTAMEKKKG